MPKKKDKQQEGVCTLCEFCLTAIAFFILSPIVMIFCVYIKTVFLNTIEGCRSVSSNECITCDIIDSGGWSLPRCKCWNNEDDCYNPCLSEGFYSQCVDGSCKGGTCAGMCTKDSDCPTIVGSLTNLTASCDEKRHCIYDRTFPYPFVSTMKLFGDPWTRCPLYSACYNDTVYELCMMAVQPVYAWECLGQELMPMNEREMPCRFYHRCIHYAVATPSSRQ